MMIELPNGNRVELDNEISIDEKLKKVEELILEFEDYISDSWETTKTKFFLNGLSNYLCWHKEEKYTHDKEVLSKRKVRQMETKIYKNNYINFSELGMNDKIILGLISDYDYESE